MRRAEAQMQLSGLLAERLRQGGGEAFKAQLSAAQERFYRACRSAKHRSAAAPDLDGRRRELKDRNSQLAAVQGFEAIRARAERQVLDHPAPPEIAPVTPTGSAVAAPVPLRSAGAFQRGTPVYWEMPTPDAAPRVSLVDVSEGRERQAALGSVLLVFLALAAWGVSRFPRAVALVHALWPELLVGLAALGWGLVGANAVSVGLGLVGVISRLMIAGRWVRAAIGRRAATGIAPGSGVSST